MQAIYQAWGTKADFALIYIREAHPEDGRQVPVNRTDGFVVNDPKTESERHKVAEDFAKQFTIKMPIFVDSLDDMAMKTFAAWPDRLYVLAPDGKVAWQGGAGPRGFNPEDIPTALGKLLP